jgi:hypothetical protein
LHEKLDALLVYARSLEAQLKASIPTICSTCEINVAKNMELAHYVDRLQDENDELRKLMGWLSGHEPQLRIMIETYKRHVVWTSLGPLHRWVPEPTTRWAPGTTRLALHGT